MQAFIKWLFGPKSYTRVGFTVWNSSRLKYQFGVAGSRTFCNQTDVEIKETLQKEYGGKLDVFIVTARWIE